EWSSSSASIQRSFSAACSDSERIETTPSGRCHARATEPRHRAVTRPSRTRRVASPAKRAESASEYGPLGRTSNSTMSRPYPPGRATPEKSVLRRPTDRPTFGRVARPVTPLDLLIGLLLVSAVVLAFAGPHRPRTPP